MLRVLYGCQLSAPPACDCVCSAPSCPPHDPPHRRIKFQASSAPPPDASEAPQIIGPQPLDLTVVEYMAPWADPAAPLLGLLRGLLEVQDREHGLLLFNWLQVGGLLVGVGWRGGDKCAVQLVAVGEGYSECVGGFEGGGGGGLV